MSMIPVEYLTVLFTLCLNEKSAEKKLIISLMCNKRINTVISRLEAATFFNSLKGEL